jgi:hypothetical protein
MYEVEPPSRTSMAIAIIALSAAFAIGLAMWLPQ